MAKIKDMAARDVEAEGEELEQSYSENPEFIQAAFTHYLRGLSLAAITRLMRPEYPTVCERTLQRICKTYGWKEARAEYITYCSKAMAMSENVLPQTIMSLLSQKAKLEARPMGAGELFAYNQLCNNLLIYTGKHPSLASKEALAVATDVETQALLEALQEDEVVGPAWKKRRAKITAAYKEKLAAAKGTKTKGKGKRG